jgi:DNA modification methylase
MTVSDQVITSDYAIYRGDCVEVAESLPSNSIDMSVYSPPFAGLFQYSGDERDMSNCTSYDQCLGELVGIHFLAIFSVK